MHLFSSSLCLPIAMLPWILFWTIIHSQNLDQLGQESTTFSLVVWMVETHWIIMAMIMGSVEDEKCLSNLGFMKRKIRNRLTTHLECLFISFLHWSHPFCCKNVFGLLQNLAIIRRKYGVFNNDFDYVFTTFWSWKHHLQL